MQSTLIFDFLQLLVHEKYKFYGQNIDFWSGATTKSQFLSNWLSKIKSDKCETPLIFDCLHYLSHEKYHFHGENIDFGSGLSTKSQLLSNWLSKIKSDKYATCSHFWFPTTFSSWKNVSFIIKILTFVFGWEQMSICSISQPNQKTPSQSGPYFLSLT